MIIRIIYTFLLGIFLAIFVGVGISAFYKAPKYPDPPAFIKYSPELSKDASQSAEQEKQMEQYSLVEKKFREENQAYMRNVSIIAIIAATIMVVISLTFFKNILVIADGILLGGIFTLVYSVLRGFETEDNMFHFFVVSTGLLISLILGYVKFIRPTEEARKKK